MVMARKQSLANKRRSQKRSNKKRARTIRSMRQVNGGARGISGFLDKFRRVKRDKHPSELTEHFLNLDEKKRVLEDPQIDNPVYYVPPEEIGVQSLIVPKLKEEEEKDALYNNLKYLLLLHVCSYDPDIVSDEKKFNRIYEFIFNPNNKHLVLDPFIEHINVLLTNNLSTIKDIFRTNTRKINSINSIDKNISKFMTHVSVDVDYLNLCSVILEQLIPYVYNDVNFSSSFNNSDKNEAAKTIASLTFLDIFKDRKVGFEPAGVMQESEFLRQHVDDIKEYYRVTAGGSKGKKKGKMPRPKSRTRKL
jgi:hypothetical protein